MKTDLSEYDYDTECKCKFCGRHPVRYLGLNRYCCIRCGVTLPAWAVKKIGGKE